MCIGNETEARQIAESKGSNDTRDNIVFPTSHSIACHAIMLVSAINFEAFPFDK